MIDFLKQHIASATLAEDKINKLRETLQLVTLKFMQDKGYFANVAFVGGTALRVLYDMRRFSEDLDFSVIRKKGYDFPKIISELEREFKLSGVEVEAPVKSRKAVHSSMLKFPGLSNALGISSLKNQKLSIKLEVDSNPPSGWRIENTIVNKIYVLNITHFDLSSLYATKLHACFFRRYSKGRDFYDFVWYLGKKTKPNYKLLNNAIKQTEGEDPALNEKSIKDFLLGRLAKVNFGTIKKDIERFLEDKSELNLLSKVIISKSISDAFD